MNVTNGKCKHRQLHTEGHLQMVSAEQREYAEACACRRIAENTNIITDLQETGLLEKILQNANLNAAYKKVKSNKGSGGVDGMDVDELLTYLKKHGRELNQQILDGKYKPDPFRRVEIPKEEKGRFRKLGIPTVVDRVYQQAIAQVLSPIFEEQFSENSFGFRPKRGAHDALKQCKRNADDGYVYVVDMDLEKFFDNVCQSKLIEILSRTIYWKQWKKVRTRMRKLRKLNLPEWVVHERANCRKGIWRAALVLNQTLTNKEIANLGYMSFTGYYLQVCEN